MTVGLSTANLANSWLDTLSNTSFTAGTTLFAQMHTADPGAAGTTAASVYTTRATLAWSAASAGSKAISGAASFGTISGLGGTETITHISVWNASSAGTFRYSFALSASKVIQNGDTVNLSTHTISLTPLAA